MINEKDLPNNYSIDLIKSINDAYFQSKGNWERYSPIGNIIVRPIGYGINATIIIDYPHHSYKHFIYFNEYDTDEEIQDKLSELASLIDGYDYIVI